MFFFGVDPIFSNLRNYENGCPPKHIASRTSKNQMEQYLENTRDAIRLSIPALITFTSLIMQQRIGVKKNHFASFTHNWRSFLV